MLTKLATVSIRFITLHQIKIFKLKSSFEMSCNSNWGFQDASNDYGRVMKSSRLDYVGFEADNKNDFLISVTSKVFSREILQLIECRIDIISDYDHSSAFVLQRYLNVSIPESLCFFDEYLPRTITAFIPFRKMKSIESFAGSVPEAVGLGVTVRQVSSHGSFNAGYGQYSSEIFRQQILSHFIDNGWFKCTLCDSVYSSNEETSRQCVIAKVAQNLVYGFTIENIIVGGPGLQSNESSAYHLRASLIYYTVPF